MAGPTDEPSRTRLVTRFINVTAATEAVARAALAAADWSLALAVDRFFREPPAAPATGDGRVASPGVGSAPKQTKRPREDAVVDLSRDDDDAPAPHNEVAALDDDIKKASSGGDARQEPTSSGSHPATRHTVRLGSATTAAVGFGLLPASVEYPDSARVPGAMLARLLAAGLPQSPRSVSQLFLRDCASSQSSRGPRNSHRSREKDEHP
mmetsp:Transcript_3592/g.13975  ORF Transcript_3592/g.13975 Transcript_3592/m.13975 type:complete len:209 (+) Transcript_3592:1336-1962(+)